MVSVETAKGNQTQAAVLCRKKRHLFISFKDRRLPRAEGKAVFTDGDLQLAGQGRQYAPEALCIRQLPDLANMQGKYTGFGNTQKLREKISRSFQMDHLDS